MKRLDPDIDILRRFRFLRVVALFKDLHWAQSSKQTRPYIWPFSTFPHPISVAVYTYKQRIYDDARNLVRINDIQNAIIRILLSSSDESLA
jgi:predicted ABC-type exoprotein transport system permease subunit